MASVEKLRKNRGVVRASVTNTITLLTDELQVSVPDASQLNSHVTYLVQKNAELGSLDKQIFDATDDDAYEEKLEAAAECDRKVSYAVSQARFFLRELAKQTTTTSASSLDATPPKADAGSDRTSAENEFNQVIHNNGALTDVDKFTYLRSVLTGDAALAIAGLPATASCYSDALDILKRRFAKDDLIIQDHMQRLIDLQPVRSPNDLRGLRSLYDTVQSQTRALKTLREQCDSERTVHHRRPRVAASGGKPG
ncbi:uncharacterized protein LOC119461913 [Dermacentor silvarum]|uniref:uncharacterized protein LOC119461913 n=1 Tax=Dermacentor silvarum TaxID=543639 RepID=UPI00189974A5|nr:uncharacterized protein LOC119461913 [Dermacentor silvarum]